jgi:hypothetical protein
VGEHGARTPEALARRGSIGFDRSLGALREAVEGACAPHTQPEAWVVPGIQAVLGFAAAEPAMAHALLVNGRRANPGSGDRECELVAHFSDRLRALAPGREPRRLPGPAARRDRRFLVRETGRPGTPRDLAADLTEVLVDHSESLSSIVAKGDERREVVSLSSIAPFFSFVRGEMQHRGVRAAPIDQRGR